jgi:hypothetical protein
MATTARITKGMRRMYKISDFIRDLSQWQAEYGDRPVAVVNDNDECFDRPQIQAFTCEDKTDLLVIGNSDLDL